jgi:hypothetical protein
MKRGLPWCWVRGFVFQEFDGSPRYRTVFPQTQHVWNVDNKVLRAQAMDAMNPPLKIAVIGTCRVHHTTRALEQAGHVHLHNGGMDSFVHSPPEILLRLQVLLGLKKYTEELVNLQVGESKDIRLSPDEDYQLLDADVLVIEVSSLKSVFAREHPLQLNEVNRHMCAPFGSFGKALMANISHAINKREPNVRLPDEQPPEDYPSHYFDLIHHLRPRVLTHEEIVKDLHALITTVDLPVLFVNHINVEGKNGRLITSRDRLCTIVKGFCEKNNTPLFEPAIMFETMDRRNLLMDDGQDVNHYAKAELLNVGLQQLQAIQNTIQRGQA